MNISPNYSNPKKYCTAKYPKRQPIYFTGLIQLLSKIALTGIKHKVEKINILKDITLDIKKGETVALVGTNGSGKSTNSHVSYRYLTYCRL